MGVEPLTPGFGTIRIKPQVASLEWVKAIIPTIRGAVQMSVENKGGKYILNVTIPANNGCRSLFAITKWKIPGYE
jgi:hypothetical protein